MRAIKIKMRNIVIVFFSLFLTLAVFSQTNAANPKPKPGFGGGDWLYFKSNNDLTAYLGKKSSSLPTVRYQKDNDYLEFSMTKALKTDISSTTDVSLETNVKTPNTPTLFYRNILDGADVNYQITNIPFKIKEEIILKETFPTSHVGKVEFLFSAETSAKPVKQKDGSIAFFGENGEYLFQLDKPFMVDGKGTRSEEVGLDIVSTQSEKLKTQKHNEKGKKFNFKFQNSNFESIFNDLILKHLNIPPFIQNSKSVNPFKIKNSNLFQNSKLKIKNSKPQHYQITLKANSAWLSTAVYPVIIDPTVTHSTDAQFNGQKNRVSDSNSSTDAVQLESSYPEAIKDPHTVLLMHFNEANGTTAGIRDYASTTRVITANGNASTTSYVTQLGLGNSAAFDGTGDYVSIPGNNDFYFTNTGSLSIDFWVKLNATNRHHGLIGGTTWSGSADTDWMIDWLDSNQLRFQKYSSGPTASIPQDTNWHHIAVIGIGGSFTLYFDGISVATSNISSSWGSQSTNLLIGTGGAHFNNVDSLYLNGYLDDFRILKGRALTPEEIKAAASRRPYAVYTSPVVDAAASVAWNTVNWTEGGVNTGNGEQPYATNSLVAQWDFNDTSGTTLTASSSGSCTTACNGTLTNFAYTASQDQATTTTGWTANNKRWGAGALMVESANSPDYISISNPASNALDPGTGDFSVEGWIKSSAAGQDTIIQNNTTVGACATNAGYILIVNGNRNLAAYASDGATCYVNNLTANASSTEIADGRWHHFAFVADRDTKAYVYYDGRLATSTTISNTNAANPAATLYLGASGATGDSDFILDSARYYSRALSAAEVLSNYQAGNIEIQTRTGATSDPNDGSWEAWKPTTSETQLLSMDSDAANWTVPDQADSSTKLLLHMDGTDAATTFVDSALAPKTVTANGNAQVDTAQSKFSGASGLFDGTGDYLSVPDSADWALGGTFTIDAWVRFNTIVNNVWIVGQGDGVAGTNFWTLYYGVTSLSFLVVQNSSTIISISNSWTPVVNRWYHVAVVDNGGTWKLFVDGVQLGTDGSDIDTVHDISSSVFVGADVNSATHLNGWLDEFRISKGIARWTSNFTPPPRAYGSNVKAENETTIKQEGTGSTKLTLGAPQVDGNTVALWRFEETGTTTGTYLYDETANNNDATTTGTTVVDGIFGKARKFNSSSDYIVSGTTATFKNFHGAADTTGFKWTIDFWTKINNFSSTQYFINNTLNADTNAGFNIMINTSREIVFQIGRNGNNLFVYSGSVGTLTYPNDNGWHHVAVTYDQALVSGNAKAYVDGVSLGSATKSGQVPDTTNADSVLRIGQSVTGTAPLNGAMDEIRMIYGRALSADEIAETYRLGANHHLTRQVSAVDLSAQTKLAFNVAADRPGTYLETMLGESDYANYELASSTLALSTTTVLYIKGDEIASSTSLKDSSFSGKAITANGNARTAGGGKIGNSVYFDGTGDYLSLADSDDWDFGTSNFTIDFWINFKSLAGNNPIIAQGADNNDHGYVTYSNTSGFLRFRRVVGTVVKIDYTPSWSPSVNKWYHIALIRNSDNFNFFVDGVPLSPTTDADAAGNFSSNLEIGGFAFGNDYTNGYLDELRIIKGTALSADQIRQAYEYGLRTHPITIDFGATLQSSDLISSATDYNFSLTATTSGLSATTSGLYLGDTIIVKENVGGTESVAQGVVKSINSSTGAVTVASWSGSVPSGGFTVNATVFKWQREYFDLSGSLPAHRNAITNITIRPTNGAEGRTIYLDDFRYNTNYLTASSSSAITSGNNRYLQYRAIFTSTDTYVSPFLSAFNTLYTALANSFPSLIGISGGGFLSF